MKSNKQININNIWLFINLGRSVKASSFLPFSMSYNCHTREYFYKGYKNIKYKDDVEISRN